MNSESATERIYKRSTRKIHLDFHTPHWVGEVGQDYDPELLVRTWKSAHVNAVTVVFGLCACGNAYYESEDAPVHPGLQVDMLQTLLPVARREEIEIFVHFGPGINDRAVLEHPEWAMRTKDGEALDTKDGTEWGWVCYNSPFIETRLYPQLRDFVRKFPEVAGIFIDMVMFPEQTCYCACCRAKAAKLGLNVNDRDDMDRLARLTLETFMNTAKSIVKAANPQMLFTCNTRWFVGGARHAALDFIELEAPVTWSAYHYPVMSRYLRTLDKHSGGMTTRFPFNWGYFGGINTPPQLAFECAEIMATLGACCIGDQLHPSGRAEAGVYETIGEAYERVERCEPWTIGARTVPYIGLVADDQRNVSLHGAQPDYYSPGQLPAAYYGAGLAMLEGSRHFDVLDAGSDFSGYRLLWLPENRTLDASLIPKVEAFVRQGGRLLVSGAGLWKQPQWRAALEAMSGLRYRESREGGAYIRPEDELAQGVPQIPHIVKGEIAVWEPLRGGDSGGGGPRLAAALFGTYEQLPMTRKFSHFHPPAGERAAEPGAVIAACGDGVIAAICAPVAEYYFRSGSPHVRRLVLNLMDALLPSDLRIVELEQPSSAVEISLMRQPGRWNLHLIQYAAKRNTGTNVIEEVPVRTSIAVRVRPEWEPKRICLAPEGTALPWSREPDGAVRFVVPELRIHAIVSIEWDDPSLMPGE